MKRVCFDRDWMVRERTDRGLGGALRVDLPHDLSISRERRADSPGGPSNAYFGSAYAEYTKTFDGPELGAGERLFFQFDGAYMNAEVRVNGHLISSHAYGYTGFRVDATDWLKTGAQNLLSVSLSSPMPNTRWYAGCGLYRHVWMCTAASAYLDPEALFAKTVKRSDGTLAFEVSAAVRGKTAGEVLRATLADDEGTVVCAAEKSADSPCVLTLDPGPTARRWSPDDPYLYTMRVSLVSSGVETDEETVRVGLRIIKVDAVNGLAINGKTYKMRGACVHHDCGPLGAASLDRAEERKVELLKASGFNAIRCAHNPPAPAMLDACDRLGVLVIDEAFDCWREGKNPNDYHVVFERDWHSDLSAMVTRDRNHPSVVLWSTGNEIIERDGRSDGAKWARALADAVRALDDTRPVMNALCGLWDFVDVVPQDREAFWAEATRDFAAPLDVVGYNYLLDRYERDHSRFPSRVVCAAETFPLEAFDNAQALERFDHLIGEFVWTGLDYLGESGIGRVWYDEGESWLGAYPWMHAWCGDIDISGVKRPQSYYRDILYGIAKKPMVFSTDPALDVSREKIARWGWPNLSRRWDWAGREGRASRVVVYSDAPEIELRLNGNVVGKKKCGIECRYTAEFTLPYCPGKLEAIAFDGAREVSRDVLLTAGKAVSLRAIGDRAELTDAYGDLCYIEVEAVDLAGNVVHGETRPVTVSVHGAGELAALANSDPKSEESFVSSSQKMVDGRMLAVVKGYGQKGVIMATCVAEGLMPATVRIAVKG